MMTTTGSSFDWSGARMFASAVPDSITTTRGGDGLPNHARLHSLVEADGCVVPAGCVDAAGSGDDAGTGDCGCGARLDMRPAATRTRPNAPSAAWRRSESSARISMPNAL